MVENYSIKWIYGVDDDITSCLQCGNTDLRTDVVNTGLSDIGDAMNWYCEKCKTVWVKGLKQPKFKK